VDKRDLGRFLFRQAMIAELGAKPFATCTRPMVFHSNQRFQAGLIKIQESTLLVRLWCCWIYANAAEKAEEKKKNRFAALLRRH